MTHENRLTVRFLRQLPGGSFGYGQGTIRSNGPSCLNGYVAKRIVGDTPRLVCRAIDMPRGP